LIYSAVLQVYRLIERQCSRTSLRGRDSVLSRHCSEI